MENNNNEIENERRENESLCPRANGITVGSPPLNPCILNSTTPVHPLRGGLGSVPVVKPMVLALSMAVWRGENVCISNIGVALLVTLIASAPI